MNMMYKYGGEKYGGMNIPINESASELFVKLYEATAIQKQVVFTAFSNELPASFKTSPKFFITCSACP